MPRLGEPVQPARTAEPEPWWRAAGAVETPPVLAPEELQAAEAAVPWPLD